MGQEIKKTNFCDEDREVFKSRLRSETSILQKHFKHEKLEDPEIPKIGLEVEAWLVDKNGMPCPRNLEFLENTNHSLLVPELSQYNFELNVDPLPLSKDCFGQMSRQLEYLWSHCEKVSEKMGIHPLLVGILPTLTDDMLSLNNMTQSNRYQALNEQLFYLRKNKDIKIHIEHFDRLDLIKQDIMLEAAATSIQVHLQVGKNKSSQFYNASIIASAPIVALAANSPFLYGHHLWDETRIPIFEQAVQVASFRDNHGQNIGRVTFGSGFSRNNLFEVFLENLDGYPTLIPLLFEDNPEELSHLKFHNGTIWRWNRPIIGHDDNLVPHLRIEQRVMASGPTITDIMANTAFYLGLTLSLSQKDLSQKTFEQAKDNFYHCAKEGLSSVVNWFGKKIDLKTLFEEVLIPDSKKALIESGVDKEEVEFYIDGIIGERVRSNQNGANWQKQFVHKNGGNFNALTEKYLENQMTGVPVHKWKS
ncbi:MAG: glutamate-cysteine ligase family protein [Bacteriovoracaceae bacterium]